MSKAIGVRMLAGLAMVASATAIVAAPADVIRTRIAGYRELGAAFKAVNDGLRGGAIQTVLIQQSAREIGNAARNQYGWFPAGSGPQAGIKTAARPAIWTQAAQFKAAQDGFARQANAFIAATKGNNPAAIRAEARKLGAACKTCHDTFRLPKD